MGDLKTNRYAEAREAAGMGVEQAAEALLVDPGTLEGIENGDWPATAAMLVTMTRIYGCTADHLLMLDPTPAEVLEAFQILEEPYTEQWNRMSAEQRREAVRPACTSLLELHGREAVRAALDRFTDENYHTAAALLAEMLGGESDGQ